MGTHSNEFRRTRSIPKKAKNFLARSNTKPIFQQISPEEKKNKNNFQLTGLEPDMQYALLYTALFCLVNCRNILTSETSQQGVAQYDLEVDADYPTELVEEAVIKAQSIVENFLKEQQQELEEGRRREKRSVKGPRWEEFSERLCKVDTRIFRPRIARHSSNPADLKLYNIVNLPDFAQRVEVRQCKNSDGHNVGQGIGGTEHWCRQEYLALPLLAVREGTNDLVLRRFNFPHGCSCYLRR